MIKSTEFCKKYGLTQNALYVAVSNKTIPKTVIAKKNEELYIDEKYIIDRYEFRLKITKEAQKMYYYLARYFKTSEIVYILNKIDDSHSQHSWRQLLNEGLFSLADRSVLAFKVPKMIYKLYRYEKWFLTRVFKMKGYKLSNCDLDKVHFLKEKKR